MEAVARRRGPVPRINREQVLDVARRLPYDRLTMAAIGAELGVTPPALYRYFPDRAAVLEALAQELVDLLEPPPATLPWREWLCEAAVLLRDLWARHGELGDLYSPSIPSERGRQLVMTGVEVLTAAGFSAEDAHHGLAAALNLSTAFGRLERHGDPIVDGERVRTISSSSDLDEVFRGALDLVLDGLAAHLPRGRRRR